MVCVEQRGLSAEAAQWAGVYAELLDRACDLQAPLQAAAEKSWDSPHVEGQLGCGQKGKRVMGA